uniref:Protein DETOXIFICATION n=2 Tax=Rhizophora mucronata TaxID=61149 RepID=A0A2P2MA55_RHIMU
MQSTPTSSSSDYANAPLLEGVCGGQERGGWWERNTRKVLDGEEAKTQILFALPMIFTNAFYYLVTLVSVMFAGHLGQLQLAGANLANAWYFATGVSLMAGLSGALETLCGQAFGAKRYRILGAYLQASCIISILFCIILSIFWFYTEPMMILLHQEPQIAKAAALYLTYLIPGVFAYGLLQNILRFLQTQSAVLPLVAFSGIPLCIHVGLTYALVNWTALGFKGAPLAASITLWVSTIMLAMYVILAKRFKHTWDGFSFESFSYFLTNLKLALPSAAMVCMESWAFEGLVLVAGIMPNAEITTSLTAMCVNTESVAYMGAFGLSAAVSTRVSNELGAANPDRAKSAMAVTLKLALVLALSIGLAIAFGHNFWAGLFSDNSTITEAFASLTPLLAISITVDAFQTILAGVARGCGWQHLAVYANLVAFYFVGLPVGMVLGLKFKLYSQGLWIGLICGLCCLACTLFVLTQRIKWTKMELLEKNDKKASISA